MILFISAQQDNLASPVNPRFGRCPFLVRFDTESNQWEAFANPGASRSGGAGVAAAQFVIDHQANAVLSGDFGPNAAGAFLAANIELRRFTGDTATVQQAVDQFLNGKLPAV